MERLPELRLADWEDSRLKWQLICQMVGKVRLKLHPPINHWWHVPLYLSPSGLATGDIPYGKGLFEVEIDLHDQCLRIRTSASKSAEVALDQRPVRDIYTEFRQALRDVGIDVKIIAKPYQCKSRIPFADDREHSAWDAAAVSDGWDVLAEIEPVFKEFRGRFLGKCSPVHMFWHSFDLAVTRFSGRRAPERPEADRVTQEAYSHEVNSAGFWFGDDNLPEAAFYCYSSPSPQGLDLQPLRPAKAFWQDVSGAPMALLRYSDWREMPDRRQGLLEFLQSSYEAGANAAAWDRASLERS
jgi:hypothetical protein